MTKNQISEISLTNIIENANTALSESDSITAQNLAIKVLSLDPLNFQGRAILGVCAFNLKHFDKSVEILDALRRKGIVNSTLLSVLALSLRMTGRCEEALDAIQDAVNLDPNDIDNLLHCALIATDNNDYDRAFTCLMRATGLDHKRADIHLAMAQHLLSLGNYEIGWREYEWRDFVPNPGNELPPMSSAPWNGVVLPRGFLMIVCDQGFGDCLQFARFIRLARLRCAKVFLACSPDLLPLLSRVEGVDQAFSLWADIPYHAAHCRLSSLPYILGLNSPTDFITPTPYLIPNDDLKAIWGLKLNAQHDPTRRIRVGLIWQGRREHPNDLRRSLSLEKLLPLSTVNNIQFVCLQKPVPDKDRKFFSAFSGLTDISDNLITYDDTAALVTNLDLVISVDSSVAHLSAAIGTRTWICIPQAPDWRWLRDGKQSVWYNNVTLFRQTHSGEWGPVIESIRTALQSEIEKLTNARL